MRGIVRAHLTEGERGRNPPKVFSKMFAAMGLVVLLIYLILVMQFGSFLEPLAIMISLPLSLIGVLMLMGIVAKNAILLIDFAKWGQERGQDRRTAIIGGVITSTLLTLVVIPTVYEILDDWRLKLVGLFNIPKRSTTGEYATPREARASVR